MAPSTANEEATYLLFVRHGTTPTTGKVLPGRAPGLHLSDAGRAEAGAVGTRLGELGSVRALYSSPMERAVETAEQIARCTSLPVEIEPGLIECDCGAWTGAGLRSVRNRRAWQAVLRHPSGFRFPGGESFIELQARVLSTIERLTLRHPGEVVVVVSHADPIKIALGSALGSPLDLSPRIVVAPCSTSIVAYGAGSPLVLAVNTFSSPALVGVPGPEAPHGTARAGTRSTGAGRAGARGAPGAARPAIAGSGT
ncbi:MAG: histidine phosphatase family protein [Acidimicrobiales bacterium]